MSYTATRLKRLKLITDHVAVVVHGPLMLFMLYTFDSKKLIEWMNLQADKMAIRLYNQQQRSVEADLERNGNLLNESITFVNPFGELIWEDSENLVCVDGVVLLTIRQIEEEEIMSDNDFLFFFEYASNGETN